MNQIGHNQLNALRGQIADIEKDLLAVKSVDANNSGYVKDLIDKAKGLVKDIENARKQTKEPHMQAAKDVDAAYNPLKEQVQEAYKAPYDMLNAWAVAERKRAEKEAEEARKKAEETARESDPFLSDDETTVAEANTQAAIAENAAKAASRVTGSGRASGLKTYRSALVKDGKALVIHFWEHPDVLGAATKLANAQIRAAKGGPVSIPGIEIKEEHRLS